jgi:4-azaleucine resistance transporter AzlC
VQALGMSVFVFAGATQLVAVPLLSAGASVAIVLLTVLVINLRLTLYSASLAPHFKRLPTGWKGLLAYLLTDQAYAATITPFDEGETKEPDKRWYYLGVAVAIWVTWQAATMLGVVLGSWAAESWSLDFVLPLIFIAAAVPAIKDRTTAAASLSAGVAALFCAALPLNLGLISAAFVGVIGGLAAEMLLGRSGR